MKKDVYICSCTEDGGILHYVLENGSMTFRDKTALPSPMYLIRGEEADDFYALLLAPWKEKPTSGMIRLRRNADGSLSTAGEIADTKGREACHLCTRKGKLYAANYTSGSIIAMPDRLVTHEGKGPNPARQETAHTHFISPSPDGKYLLVCDLGLDSILTYDENLRELSRAKIPSGNGARHLCYSDDGKWILCACELSSSVSVFSYRDGVLTFSGDYPNLAHRVAEATDNTAAAIRIRGGRVYVSNRGHDSITVFDFDEKSGSLSHRADYSCFGKVPRDFDLCGGLLIATNQESDSVTVLDAESGKLLAEFGEIKKPICVCIAE